MWCVASSIRTVNTITHLMSHLARGFQSLVSIGATVLTPTLIGKTSNLLGLPILFLSFLQSWVRERTLASPKLEEEQKQECRAEKLLD